jgi:hypothetical protein
MGSVMKFTVILLCGFLTLCAVILMDSSDTEDHLCIARFPVPEQNSILQTLKLRSDQFSLSFIHSVSMTPVFDDYIVKNGQIIQIQERFSSHGAGLPSMADDSNNENWQLVDGVFHLKMERDIQRLIVRVNPDYNNYVLIGDETYDLTRWGRMAVEISICESHIKK